MYKSTLFYIYALISNLILFDSGLCSFSVAELGNYLDGTEVTFSLKFIRRSSKRTIGVATRTS